ncbi:MAG: T9SS type A sorting domain-containing protein [Chitinophagaceae bacterium]|nr:T9SS type A sorting domain-containing protein [Chitinophagaceae bacterium]
MTHYAAGIVLGDGLGGLIMGSVPPLVPNAGLGTGHCIADFNEDGKLDLVHTAVPSDTLYVYLGVPGFDSLSYTPEKIFSVGGSSPYFLLSADFNGDGHADIASANEGATNITVYLNALPQTTPNATSGIRLENTQFTLYPNPAKERVFLYLPSQHTKSITVEMYDFTARKVKTYSETTKDQHISMPLDDLLPGIYSLEIYSEQEHIGHQTLQILPY